MLAVRQILRVNSVEYYVTYSQLRETVERLSDTQNTLYGVWRCDDSGQGNLLEMRGSLPFKCGMQCSPERDLWLHGWGECSLFLLINDL